MSREEILAMNEGPELNVLVQKHVFGSEVFEIPAGWAYKTDSSWHFIPNYSSSISAAWKVQEKLQDYGGMVLGCYGSKNGNRWFTAQTIVTGKEISVTSHTAPEAICKVALLAVMDG